MYLRKELNDFYLEFFNDFLTIERFAEYQEMSIEETSTLLDIGRKINQQGVNFQHTNP